MSTMATEHQGPTPLAGPETSDWRERYPERWRQEIAALEATGWAYRIRSSSAGAPQLELDYPLPIGHGSPVPEPETVTLLVTFGADYPWFPPRFFDLDQRLALKRHKDPSTRALCLIEESDWRLTMTIADALTTQLPKLIEAGRAPVAPANGIEVVGPEPVEAFLPRLLAPVLLTPERPIPAGVDQGALVVRYTYRGGRHPVLGCALIEHLFAPGIDVRLGGPPAAVEKLIEVFTLVGYGRWLRDPAFDPAASASETYQRLQSRLMPLALDTPQGPGPSDQDDTVIVLDPDRLEMLLLVVPSERGHRDLGEGLIALLREAPSATNPGWCEYVQVQPLGPDVTRVRTPETAGVGSRHVVVVGTGAIGGHVADDMARAGVGRLDLVDGDHIDVATAARQCAPAIFAGRNKADVLGTRLGLDMPFVDLQVLPIDVGSRHLMPDTDDPSGHEHRAPEPHQQHYRKLDEALRTADLVIDATANPTATRYLAALRQRYNKAFLHVAATAGAWGGTVFLTTRGDHACWACLQHHRLEGTLPIPPADPGGLITPAGCTDPTFTGTSADLATIAHHASRLALHHLLQPALHDKPAPAGGLGPGLYVAALRDERGTPCPATWRATTLPIHPDCPLHHHGQTPAHETDASTPDPASYAVGEHAPCPTTAPTTAERTLPPEPPNEKGHHRNTEAQGTADGTSPAGAPIQRSQQRT